MRVTLIHNPTAGDAAHSGRHLSALLRAKGHDVHYHSTRGNGLARALAKPTDLIVAAGGDGTVGKVARQLVGREARIAIVPLGTANNVAWALGLDLDALPETHLAALATADTRTLDVGVARAPWGTRPFLESAGVGCLAPLFERSFDAHPSDGGQRKRPVARLRRLVEQAQVRRRNVTADEVDLSGDYLLVAALNAPRIGPRVELAPGADLGDGWLDLVLVRDADRAALVEYLRCLEAGEPARMPLTAHRVRRISVDWEHGDGHVDDDAWPDEEDRASPGRAGRERATVEIELTTPSLHVAVPAGCQARPR